MSLMKEGPWSTVSETERQPDVDAGTEVQTTFDKRRDEALPTIVLSVDT